jgi:hypothetical protein
VSDIRSRRAGIGPDEARQRPLYARVLGLQFLRLSSLMCFMFFEGAIALAVLLALAELVDYWAVLVLPVSVAAMVKINDVIAGATTRSGGSAVPRARRLTAPIAGPAAGESASAGPAPVIGRAHAPTGAGQAPVPTGPLREAAPPEPVSGEPTSHPHGEQRIISPEQRARQSANYRYE